MVQYRRNRIAGGTYFFTVTLHDRRNTTLIDHIPLLRTSFRRTLRKRPFIIDAIVILPEHLHTIWTLPEGDIDYPGRWRLIKKYFSHDVARQGVKFQCNADYKHRLWQDRYWEHTIRDEIDYARHVDYIHFNPVKHGWVTQVQNWPYSSFHRYVKRGIYQAGWGGGDMAREDDMFGE